ncbi:hypothetical protein F5Y02DRAFT_414312 [Annulohypoxylon stygium]|nr:hypothetical protein F5Y02DRAFT_414312 [Annulohypoxylon stygium]
MPSNESVDYWPCRNNPEKRQVLCIVLFLFFAASLLFGIVAFGKPDNTPTEQLVLSVFAWCSISSFVITFVIYAYLFLSALKQESRLGAEQKACRRARATELQTFGQAGANVMLADPKTPKRAHVSYQTRVIPTDELETIVIE